ncbi:uncharacterized protein LOC110454632 [Mizuhopecten yessoensis]|uniref:uncharacterized protein LOC110454632 n=1 Tax=Mizuhopecten yessoensis TaxID=6573 RepID=UPI000B458F21|nr:uncharacterized protein LOC110454632 [Mizuhopecten yessoensis]
MYSRLTPYMELYYLITSTMSRTWQSFVSKRRNPSKRGKESALTFWVVDHTWQSGLFDQFEKVCNTVLQVKPTRVSPPEMVSYCQTNPMRISRSEYPLVTRNVVGDGNCFFRCISYLLCGSEELHMAVRNWVVCNISSRDVGMSVARYVHSTRMDRKGVWATDHEIIATANILNTDIFVFSKYASDWKWMEFRCKRRRRRRNIPKRFN